MSEDSLSEVELRAALVQVRSAYRLLHDYHRRLLDLIALVKDDLARTHGPFEWFYWSSNEFSRLSTNKDPSQRWAWDQIPIMASYLNWCTARAGLPQGSIFLGFAHNGDTGFDKPSTGEPDPKDFEPVDTAQTQLEAWVVYIEAGDFPSYTKAREFIGEEGWDEGHQVKRSDDKVVHYGSVTVDVSKLHDRAGVEQHVLAPLRQFLSLAQVKTPSVA